MYQEVSSNPARYLCQFCCEKRVSSVEWQIIKDNDERQRAETMQRELAEEAEIIARPERIKAVKEARRIKKMEKIEKKKKDKRSNMD